jgi:hypothetical protein
MLRLLLLIFYLSLPAMLWRCIALLKESLGPLLCPQHYLCAGGIYVLNMLTDIAR